MDQLLYSPRPVLVRRHSVTVCETPVRPQPSSSFITASDTKLQKRISVADGLDDDIEDDESQSESLDDVLESPSSPTSYRINTPEMHANLHSEFLNSVSTYLPYPLTQGSH